MEIKTKLSVMIEGPLLVEARRRANKKGFGEMELHEIIRSALREHWNLKPKQRRQK